MLWIWQAGADQFWTLWWANFLAFPPAALIAWGIFYLTGRNRRRDRKLQLMLLLDLLKLEFTQRLQRIDTLQKLQNMASPRNTNLAPASEFWNTIKGEIISLGKASDQALQRLIIFVNFAHEFYYDAQWLSEKFLAMDYGPQPVNVLEQGRMRLLYDQTKETLSIRLSSAKSSMLLASEALQKYRADLGGDAEGELTINRLYEAIRASIEAPSNDRDSAP